MTDASHPAETGIDADRPTSPRDLLRLLAGPHGRSALDALRDVAIESNELEGFRPLSESLEWRLADSYWNRAGVLPFVRNDVPYLVNNTGRLSENAAELVFTAFTEIGPALPARLVILELGAGTGLHARYFLDAFSARCREDGSDFYDRLQYVVSDRFQRTVTGWEREGVYAEHRAHVALRICDAAEPTVLTLPDGKPAPPVGAPVVVFCNYLLDVLPSTIVRRTTSGLEALGVRTHLGSESTALRSAGLASLEEARALAASGQPGDLNRLLPLLPHLDLETAFQPWIPAAGVEEELAADVPDDQRAIINGGALACLDKLLNVIHGSGFILVNDYGPVRTQDVAGHVGVQRFGGSVALGLNFPALERALIARGIAAIAPPGDEQRRVHTRLLARLPGPRTIAVLHARFGFANDQRLDAPQEEARAHLAAGRRNEAVASYRQMVERNPRDWQMLGEAAEYVGLQLGDHAAGLELARAALERNPWYSAWLWNVLGDCLFYRDKLEDAHAAFTQARRIDPDDPRTNLNLAYTFSARGEQTEALAILARGLAHDVRGLYRPRLLEKQAQILGIISDRAAAEQGRLVRRAERFR